MGLNKQNSSPLIKRNRESTNGGAKRKASAGWKRQKTKQGKKRRKEKASVMIHFEDTAFDDAHVSVPHSLMSEGQKTERQTESKL